MKANYKGISLEGTAKEIANFIREYDGNESQQVKPVTFPPYISPSTTPLSPCVSPYIKPYTNPTTVHFPSVICVNETKEILKNELFTMWNGGITGGN